MKDSTCLSTSAISDKANDFIYSLTSNSSCQAWSDAIKESELINDKLRSTLELVQSSLVKHENSINAFTPYIPIIAVLLGSVAAYCFTRYHWSFSEKKKKEMEFFSKISSLTSDIEKIAVGYWIKDHNSDDMENEVYIKSKFRLLNKYVQLLDEKQIKTKQELESFVSNLFDLVTGDDFESKDRKASASKAISVSYICADLNATISSL